MRALLPLLLAAFGAMFRLGGDTGFGRESTCRCRSKEMSERIDNVCGGGEELIGGGLIGDSYAEDGVGVGDVGARQVLHHGL